MASEKGKMIAERLYYSFGPELTAERTAAQKLCEEYNKTTGASLAFCEHTWCDMAEVWLPEAGS